MHNTFYTYTDLLDFIDDIIKNKKIWTKYGLIHSFTIANVLTPITEGYISLYVRNNNIIQNLSKQVFTLAQFKTIIFSNEVQGIEVYKKKYPLKSIDEVLSDWSDLNLVERDEYIDLGNRFTDELDKFPTFIFPDVVTQPVPQELVPDQTLDLRETFSMDTGLHRFVINNEILFHVYYDYHKNEYLITLLSSNVTETKDTVDKINVYIEEDGELIIQNQLETSINIRKYSNYV
jgi:hypothetical protein